MTDRLKVEGFQWQVTSINLIKWSPFEQEKLNWQSWIRNFFSTKEKNFVGFSDGLIILFLDPEQRVLTKLNSREVEFPGFWVQQKANV